MAANEVSAAGPGRQRACTAHYGPGASTARPSALDNRARPASRRPTPGPLHPSPQLSTRQRPGRPVQGGGHDSTGLAACSSQEADDRGPRRPQAALAPLSGRPCAETLLYGRPRLEPGSCTLAFSRCRLVPPCRLAAADLQVMAASVLMALPAGAAWDDISSTTSRVALASPSMPRPNHLLAACTPLHSRALLDVSALGGILRLPAPTPKDTA